MRKKWTDEEIAYLEDSWGRVSIPGIAKKLGRTETAVILKSQRLGLGSFLESGDYITFNQLLIAVCGSNTGSSYKIKSWVKNRGFPLHYKRRKNQRVRVVYLKEFWKWAYNNRSFIDFTKMELFILGKEPEWLEAQRKHDYKAFSLQRKDPWTPAEDDQLRHMLKRQKYGYAELSQILRRSAGAIQRRCCDLGLRERPVKADNHTKWTAAELHCVAEGISSGANYTEISMQIGKSEKAVRGKVYSVYQTESLDKVRLMLVDSILGLK